MFSKFFYIVLAGTMSASAVYADVPPTADQQTVEEFTPEEMQAMDENTATIEPEQGFLRRVWRCQAWAPRKSYQRYWGRTSNFRPEAMRTALRACQYSTNSRCTILTCVRRRY